ncbi:MAG: hypothetical protein AAB767_04205, partial [Patescibacteria group bacterium]
MTDVRGRKDCKKCNFCLPCFRAGRFNQGEHYAGVISEGDMRWDKLKLKEMSFQVAKWCKEKGRAFLIRSASFLKMHHDTILAVLIPAIAVIFGFLAS